MKIWSYNDNITGWTALLGGTSDDKTISEYAAPARVVDPSNLPKTYIEVGELDIFRDENIEYARRLGLAGVSTELHVHPGVPHAWEVFAPDIEISRRSFEDRVRTIRDI